jgi:hypothetical protein
MPEPHAAHLAHLRRGATVDLPISSSFIDSWTHRLASHLHILSYDLWVGCSLSMYAVLTHNSC